MSRKNITIYNKYAQIHSFGIEGKFSWKAKTIFLDSEGTPSVLVVAINSRPVRK